MLEGEAPPLLPPEDVVRSVFEIGGDRLSLFEVDAVISTVRSVLTRGSFPVQEESISSSSSSSPSSSTSFWFLLSSSGAIDYISEGCQQLLGIHSSNFHQKSAFSMVAIRDHHIVPPILNVGPCTSMSCRLHLRNSEGSDAPFDVTFAKLSTRQLTSDVENERSATLCVARAVAVSHGKVTISLSPSFYISKVENRSSVSFETSLLLSRHVSDLVSKADTAVLDTLLEAHSECSAQLSLSLAGVAVGALVRSVHPDDGSVILHCDINKIESNLPIAEVSPGLGGSILANNDRLTELCSTVFSSEEGASCSRQDNFDCSSSGSLAAERAKRPIRKPRMKRTKSQPEQDSCLKKLLACRSSGSLDAVPFSSDADYSSSYTE